METRKLTINISSELHEELKTIAFFRKVSMTEILLEKIREVVDEEKLKPDSVLKK